MKANARTSLWVIAACTLFACSGGRCGGSSATNDGSSSSNTSASSSASSTGPSNPVGTASAKPTPTETPVTVCKADPWPTFAHDARRTGVTEGCCAGKLKELWRFKPPSKDKREGVAETPIVTDDGIYVGGLIGESTAVFGLTHNGELRWTFDSRTDIHHGQWPIAAHGVVAVNDDGLFMLNPGDGKQTVDHGLDTWGQLAADDERFYFANACHVEGPLAFVCAADQRGEPLWQQNKLGSSPQDVMDELGAIAIDGGALFQAAEYRFTAASRSGLYAFERRAGTPRWTVKTSPRSDISANDGKVFGVERQGKGLALIARNQADGGLVWSSDVRGTDQSSPLIVNDEIITFSYEDGWQSRDALSGTVKWQTPSPVKRPVESLVGKKFLRTSRATHAAATRDGHLIVTAGGQVRVLRTQDGKPAHEGALGDGLTLGKVVHSPVPALGNLYVIADGALVALSCE
ncbi:MAG: PQQ-binding-like beta-propeller repeat protein [Polyangiaceae bacterium]